MSVPDTTVIIAGAGPTGLMLANWLHRLGVPYLILDGKSGPTRESRAIVMQARTLEIYDQLGIIDQVRDQVTDASRLVVGWRDRPARSPVPISGFGIGRTPFPGLHIIEQSATEQIGVAALQAVGGQVHWHHQITDQQAADDAIAVTVTTPQGHRTLTGRWLVAADGASSSIRERADIPFSGTTQPAMFWVIDADQVTGLPPHAVNLRFAESNFLVAFPLGGNRQRLTGIAHGPQPTEAQIRAELASQFGIRWSETNWLAHYRVHHRVADRYRSGPVILAGDAAHVHSPVGGQGMNTGIQDAHNLAFTLAAIHAGDADQGLLDRYQAERRPVALQLVSTTDRYFSAVVRDSRVARWLRRTLVPLYATLVGKIMPHLRLGHRVAEYLGQLRIHYRMPDPPASDDDRRQIIGRRLIWTGNNHEVLREAHWQVHAYGSAQPTLRGLPKLIKSAHRFGQRCDLGLYPDLWYLVRPDGFVAAAAQPASAPTVFPEVLADLGYRT